MKLTTETFDRFYNGQQIQEKLGVKPTTAANIGFNHALNGGDFVSLKEDYPNEFCDYLGWFLLAEEWIQRGFVFFKKNDIPVKVIKDGDAYICFREDFVNLQESHCYAFGDTFDDAINQYFKTFRDARKNEG